MIQNDIYAIMFTYFNYPCSSRFFLSFQTEISILLITIFHFAEEFIIKSNWVKWMKEIMLIQAQDGKL